MNILWVICLIILFGSSGCGEPAYQVTYLTRSRGITPVDSDTIRISDAQALEIALNEDNARSRLPKGTPIEIDFQDGAYEVTFLWRPSRPMPGPDFISKIKIDPKSGKVIARIIGN